MWQAPQQSQQPPKVASPKLAGGPTGQMDTPLSGGGPQYGGTMGGGWAGAPGGYGAGLQPAGGMRTGLWGGGGTTQPTREQGLPSTGGDWNDLINQGQKLYGGNFAQTGGNMGAPTYGTGVQRQATGPQPFGKTFGSADTGGMALQKAGDPTTAGPADTPQVQTNTTGGAAPVAANVGNWAPIDPGGSYTPEDALSQVEQRLGSALSPEHRQLAIQAAQQAGWSGSGPLTGAHLNAVFALAQQMTGNRPPPTPGSGPPAGPGVPAPQGWTPGGPQPPMPPGTGGGPDVWGTPVPPGAGPGYVPPNYTYTPPPGGGPPTPPPGQAPYQTTPVPESTYGGIQLPPELQAPPDYTYQPYQGPGNFQSSSQVPGHENFTYQGYQGPNDFASSQQVGTPERFGYDAYEAPTVEEMRADPSYQGRLKEGEDRLALSKVAQGTARSGATLRALQEHGQDFASREYANVAQRKMAEHAMGYGEARETAGFNTENQRRAQEARFGQEMATHTTNVDQKKQAQATQFAQSMQAKGYNDEQIRKAQADRFGQEFASHGMNVQTARDTQRDQFTQGLQTHGYNFGNKQAVYDRSVDAATLRDRSARETEADKLGRNILQDERGWRQYQYEGGERRFQQEFQQRAHEFASTDDFRRKIAADDATYRAARDAEGDRWKREVMDEERRRFLAELGQRG